MSIESKMEGLRELGWNVALTVDGDGWHAYAIAPKAYWTDAITFGGVEFDADAPSAKDAVAALLEKVGSARCVVVESGETKEVPGGVLFVHSLTVNNGGQIVATGNSGTAH